MTSTKTTFNTGDRVQHKGNERVRGVVTKVEELQRVTLRLPNGTETYYYNEDLITAPSLSPDEAWTEVTLLVGRLATAFRLPLYESETKIIRRDAYKILYTNGIEISLEVKERVRNLIERAEAQLKEQANR